MLKPIIQKIKRDPSDDYDTEYIDIDTLLNMYVKEYRAHKKHY